MPINGVYESISSIILNAKKISGLKNETKLALDEFAQKVEKCRSKGITETGEENNEKEKSPEVDIQNTPKRTPESRFVNFFII